LSGESVAEDLRVNAVLAVVNSRQQGAGSTNAENRTSADSDIELLTNTLAMVSSPEFKREISFEISRIFMDSGRIDEAAPRVKAYISDNSDAVTAAALQLKMGDALLNENRCAEAVVVYQQYLEIFVNAGGHANAQFGRGWALMGVERYAEAALAFEKAYDLFNESKQKSECLFKIGDAFFANTQYKKAITIYDRFREEFPESKYQAKALFQSGVCQQSLEQYDEAELIFEEVAKDYSDSVEAKESLLRIGGVHELQGEWKAAEDLYDRMMKLYPSGPFFVRALRGRGGARYQQWSPDALDDFERLVKEFPGSEDAEYAFFMRAMCLYRIGRDSQAFEICKEFMSRYKDSRLAPIVRFWVGRFAYNSGDFIFQLL
jgi:TolA-binding protein